MNRLHILALLLNLMLVRGLIYGAVIPPWQAPDEHEHFEYAKLVLLKRRPVTYEDRSPELEREIIQSLDRYSFWRFARISEKVAEMLQRGNLPQSLAELPKLCCGSHLHQPPMYYLLGAAVISTVPAADTALQLLLVRLMSLLFSLIVVWLAYETSMLLFPDDLFLQIGVPAFIVFLPMYTYMTGAVNNDHVGVLVSSVVIYVLAVSLRRGFSLSRVLLVLVGLVVGYYGKRTFFFTVPLVPLTFFLRYVSRRHEVPRWAKVALPIGAMVVAVGAMTLVGGDRLSKWWSAIYLRLSLNNPLDVDGMRAVLRAHYALYGQRLFESFWARFGWMNIPLDPFWYTLLAIVTAGSVIGLGVFIYRLRIGRVFLAGWQKHILVLYIMAILFIVTIAAISTLATAARLAKYDVLFMPQGRYLFPAIIPIATLFVLGLRQLVPDDHQIAGLLVYLASLITLDLVGLIGYIIPFFYT